MGTRYSANSINGFNSVPPSDDGAQVQSNKVIWATIKTKLADPIKTLAEAIDSDLQTHFNVGPNAYTSNQTLGASHYNQIIQVSGASVTLTLSDAATLGAGWYCWIVNTDSSNSVTLARATGADTINGSAANYTIGAGQAIKVFVIAAANGFRMLGNNFVGGAFPSGTKMLFQQTSAPTGWTKDTTHNDKALRVVSGTASSGGATAFTSVFGSGKTTGSHTLTLAEIPSHTHTFASNQVYDGAGGTGGYQAGSGVSTGAAGGGGGHTHTLSLDLQYVDLIIATKD